MTDQPAAPAVTITSFGYGHQPGGVAPAAHLTVDLRQHFRDPHVDPSMWELTGRDQAVVTAVLSTPGIPALIAATLAAARAFCSGPSAGPLHIAAGCVGGRHRSYVVAAALGTLLADLDPAVVHLHVDRPVIRRHAPQN